MKLRCAICNRILRGGLRGRYCRPCLSLVRQYRQEQLERDRQKRLRQERQELLEQEFGTNRLKVFEYSGQELLPGGRYAITGHTPIRRKCADCGKDDQLVRGNWAPVFEDAKNRLYLLCWPCYLRHWDEPE